MSNSEIPPVWEAHEIRAMQRALAEAELGRGHVEPNPLVGAVVLQGETHVGVGYHARFGGPHAEVVALNRAGPLAAGSTLFVTLEPCCHHGKTPPCTEAILKSGVAEVIVSVIDPFAQVDGGGITQLRRAGLRVRIGLLADLALYQLAPFLKRQLTGLPYVIAKWAMTLDGKMATAHGSSQWITGPQARRSVHELRGQVDAILVGIQTALADDPLLTARPPGPRVPARLILDSRAQLPLSSRLMQTLDQAPVWIAVSELAPIDRCNALTRAGAEILRFSGPGPIPLDPLLRELAQRGVTNLLVEGGGRVLGGFLDAHQIDRIEAYLAPIVEGGDHPRTPVRGLGLDKMSQARRLSEPIQTIQLGPDLLIKGTLPSAWWDEAIRRTQPSSVNLP